MGYTLSTGIARNARRARDSSPGRGKEGGRSWDDTGGPHTYPGEGKQIQAGGSRRRREQGAAGGVQRRPRDAE